MYDPSSLYSKAQKCTEVTEYNKQLLNLDAIFYNTETQRGIGRQEEDAILYNTEIQRGIGGQERGKFGQRQKRTTHPPKHTHHTYHIHPPPPPPTPTPTPTPPHPHLHAHTPEGPCGCTLARGY